MFSKKTLPLWIAIIALSSLYLMGQGWEPDVFPAKVAKTGQITSYASGDDGDLQKGVVWPVPRFTDNVDGTVTDNLTGLIWTTNSDCEGIKDWDDALDYCNSLADGTCGLSDSSGAGDWRLANRLELEGLLDAEYFHPSLPDTQGTGQWSEGDPFTNMGAEYWYWSSTTVPGHDYNAFRVYFGTGKVDSGNKTSDSYYVWCVR